MTPSEEQERDIADQLARIFAHGRRQPGSGNQAIAPNDVAVVNELHVEAKYTDARSITLHYDWISNAVRRALSFGVPAFVAIRFRKYRLHDYFIVEDTAFYDLLTTKVEHERLLKRIREMAHK